MLDIFLFFFRLFIKSFINHDFPNLIFYKNETLFHRYTLDDYIYIFLDKSVTDKTTDIGIKLRFDAFAISCGSLTML